MSGQGVSGSWLYYSWYKFHHLHHYFVAFKWWYYTNNRMKKMSLNRRKIKLTTRIKLNSHTIQNTFNNQIGKQYYMVFLSYPFLSSRVPNIEFKCLFSHKQHFGHKGCPVKYKESTDLSKWGGKDWKHIFKWITVIIHKGPSFTRLVLPAK